MADTTRPKALPCIDRHGRLHWVPLLVQRMDETLTEFEARVREAEALLND